MTTLLKSLNDEDDDEYGLYVATKVDAKWRAHVALWHLVFRVL